MKKNEESWKRSALMVSILVSLWAMRLAKSSSSLCHSFRSKRWPGLSEISVRGWSSMASIMLLVMEHNTFLWWLCSWSTGISTMWVSFVSPIVVVDVWCLQRCKGLNWEWKMWMVVAESVEKMKRVERERERCNWSCWEREREIWNVIYHFDTQPLHLRFQR